MPSCICLDDVPRLSQSSVRGVRSQGGFRWAVHWDGAFFKCRGRCDGFVRLSSILVLYIVAILLVSDFGSSWCLPDCHFSLCFRHGHTEPPEFSWLRFLATLRCWRLFQSPFQSWVLRQRPCGSRALAEKTALRITCCPRVAIVVTGTAHRVAVAEYFRDPGTSVGLLRVSFVASLWHPSDATALSYDAIHFFAELTGSYLRVTRWMKGFFRLESAVSLDVCDSSLWTQQEATPVGSRRAASMLGCYYEN